MRVYGDLGPDATSKLRDLLHASEGLEGLEVRRRRPARSSVPHPQSTDLELALKDRLVAVGFEHHVWLEHPRTGEGFEFHVHEGTRVGVVLVPRYKWISSKRTDTNYAATLKALAFADRYMAVDALVVFAYDWSEGRAEGLWRLSFPEEKAS